MRVYWVVAYTNRKGQYIEEIYKRKKDAMAQLQWLEMCDLRTSHKHEAEVWRVQP